MSYSLVVEGLDGAHRVRQGRLPSLGEWINLRIDGEVWWFPVVEIAHVLTPGEGSPEEEIVGIAVKKAYKMAGIDNPRKQIDVVEAYDPFSNAEIGYYLGLGFCSEAREATRMVEDGFGVWNYK